MTVVAGGGRSAMIVVAGGGPAGLAAATFVVRAGRAAVVHEAGTYPRHRVCGEFLSPDAAPALAAIGLDGLSRRLGAPEIGAVRVTASRGGRRLAEASFALDAPGWGIARFDFDAALAGHARREGVEVRERSRAGGTTDGATAHVVATGRLVRAGDGARAADASQWVAVKRHVRGVALPGVTELHCAAGVYAGLNEVACGGERVVNVCALVRSDAWDAAGREPEGVWRLLAAESPHFAARWTRAAPVEGSDATAAGFGFRARGAVAAGGALAVGDAAALTAPLSGAGQAAALASGIDAARCLLAASPDTAADWARRHGSRFRPRVAAGAALQRALLSPAAAAALLRIVAATGASSWLYRRTRGAW
jgi:flavin-dependent dehydrogenase